jgi:hypothetical protein
MSRTSVASIRESLTGILQGAAAGVVVTSDYIKAAESAKSILIDNIVINYTHDLDSGSYRSLTAELMICAKAQSDLDVILDGIDLLDNTARGILQPITLERVNLGEEDDPDAKVARATISAQINDPV